MNLEQKGAGTTLGVVLNDEIAEKVVDDAEREKRSVSNFLRVIIEKHYEKQEKITSEEK